MKFSFEDLKKLFQKYESAISSATLIFGFTIDYLTLNRIDFWWDNFFIASYLILAGLNIAVINLYEEGRLRNKFFNNIHEFLPFVMQFCFGGLFSAFVVFYSKSASLFTSGVFVLVLAFLLIGNEFFKSRYSKLVFQVGIYFVAIFSFSIYFLPVLLRQMGGEIFIYSGVASLMIILAFIYTINILAPERYKKESKFLILTVALVYISINGLYFANIIPPLPLSLKEGDVYHQVERLATGSYLALGESDTIKEKFNLSQDLNLRPDEPVYVFSSVFAPTRLETKITHNWQYYDEEERNWRSVTRVSFFIEGGRNEGYRGYSKKENIFPGTWRVDIETERGQVIGRVKFDIEIVDQKPELIEEII